MLFLYWLLLPHTVLSSAELHTYVEKSHGRLNRRQELKGHYRVLAYRNQWHSAKSSLLAQGASQTHEVAMLCVVRYNLVSLLRRILRFIVHQKFSMAVK